MDIENEVCGLNESKKLGELGIKYDSLFVWRKFRYKDTWEITDKDFDDEYNFYTKKDGYSAFTIGELGEILPYDVQTYDTHYYLYITKFDDCVDNKCSYWVCSYQGEYLKAEEKKQITKILCRIKDKTDANTRAKMLIYLIENKLIKI